jgi:hypothetical protein
MLENFIALIMMPQNYATLAELGLRGNDPLIALGIAQKRVIFYRESSSRHYLS